MKHKKIIYTNKKQSLRGIMSTILGIISIVSLSIVVYLSYLKAGDAQISYGLTGLLAAIFSTIGLALGMITVQERMYFRFFSGLGIVLNLVALGFVGFLLHLGL